MKVTVEWLKDYVKTEASAEEIGATLTMLGLELEAVEDSALGPVLDFKVTPNRGDCLSVLGLARELCAKDVHRFAPTELFSEAVRGFPVDVPTGDANIVRIEDSDLCPRYAAMMFDGVNIGQSSEKIQQRLTACGMRPINIVVDTTNYVMLELGQPLHAFDRDRLAEKRIVVRRASVETPIGFGAVGETMKTLDGVNRAFKSHMLLICDAADPVAIAGIMGGEHSEVSPTTKSLLLESAHFDAASVRRTRKTLGIATEASYRFERFVDPEGVVRALNRFASLLGIGATSLVDDYPGKLGPRVPVTVRETKWNRLLGLDVPISGAATILQSLGCNVKESSGALMVTAPSWRPDLVLEEDFIEEIGRVWGYEKIPEALPFGSTPQGGESATAAFRTKLREGILRLGFTEAENHTLTQRSVLDPKANHIRLRNFAAWELAYLRCSLLPGLAATAAKNRGRELFLFEIGRIFEEGKERTSLAFLISGKLLPEHWQKKESPDADFFAAKGIVDELAALVGRDLQFEVSQDARFHPTRQSNIAGLGIMGELKNDICEQLDLPSGALAAELDIDALFDRAQKEKVYKPLSNFPAVRRDLAFVIDKSVPYEKIAEQMYGDLVEEVKLFDVYEGKGIPAGKHSLAVAMVLRHPKKTLTDEEANEERERAFRALESLGAQRR